MKRSRSMRCLLGERQTPVSSGTGRRRSPYPRRARPNSAAPAGVGDLRPGQNLLVVPLEAEPTPVRPARQGQGPVWDDGAGELLWVDAAGWIRSAEVGPAGAVSDLAVWPVGEPVGAVALTTVPGWLLAAGSGFRRLAPDGELGVLLDLEGPGRMCGGGCDRAGRFLAGVTGLPETRGVGAVHRVDIDGVVSIALTDLEEPAAIAWSPDDDVLYLADSGARTVTAYDYDPDLGTADRPRVLLDFPMDEPAIPPAGLASARCGAAPAGAQPRQGNGRDALPSRCSLHRLVSEGGREFRDVELHRGAY
jgi:SMP-30/Gluconolactonase/LRE-like region